MMGEQDKSVRLFLQSFRNAGRNFLFNQHTPQSLRKENAQAFISLVLLKMHGMSLTITLRTESFWIELLAPNVVRWGKQKISRSIYFLSWSLLVGINAYL